MPFHWGEIPRHYAPRQRELIEQARAYAERQAEDEANAEFDPRELIAQAYIDGCAAGWDARDRV